MSKNSELMKELKLAIEDIDKTIKSAENRQKYYESGLRQYQICLDSGRANYFDGALSDVYYALFKSCKKFIKNIKRTKNKYLKQLGELS